MDAARGVDCVARGGERGFSAGGEGSGGEGVVCGGGGGGGGGVEGYLLGCGGVGVEEGAGVLEGYFRLWRSGVLVVYSAG